MVTPPRLSGWPGTLDDGPARPRLAAAGCDVPGRGPGRRIVAPGDPAGLDPMPLRRHPALAALSAVCAAPGSVVEQGDGAPVPALPALALCQPVDASGRPPVPAGGQAAQAPGCQPDPQRPHLAAQEAQGHALARA